LIKVLPKLKGKMFSDFLLSFSHITEIFTIVNLTKPSVLSRLCHQVFYIYVHKINFGMMHADIEIEAEIISLKDWMFFRDGSCLVFDS